MLEGSLYLLYGTWATSTGGVAAACALETPAAASKRRCSHVDCCLRALSLAARVAPHGVGRAMITLMIGAITIAGSL